MKVPTTTKLLTVIRLALILLILMLIGQPVAQAAILATADAGTDTVYFESSAKLEFIEGTSPDITGWIDFDPESIIGNVNGIFRVDLRTLKTSIAKRDEHMRSDHLHTDKYPYAYFEVNQLSSLSNSVGAGGSDTLLASGYFYLHGVKRKFKSEFELSKGETDAGKLEYKLKANFIIRLDDFDIPRPKLLLLKLAKEIEILIVLNLSSEHTPASIDLPDYKLAE